MFNELLRRLEIVFSFLINTINITCLLLIFSVRFKEHFASFHHIFLCFRSRRISSTFHFRSVKFPLQKRSFFLFCPDIHSVLTVSAYHCGFVHCRTSRITQTRRKQSEICAFILISGTQTLNPTQRKGKGKQHLVLVLSLRTLDSGGPRCGCSFH